MNETCPDCGVTFPAIDGPTHKYLGGSPSCWNAFNEVLAREFQDPAYFAVHRLTVDAYTTQHPGDQSDRRARQSVNIHLTALYLLIEEQADYQTAINSLKTLANSHKDKFFELQPPSPSDYKITINDIKNTTSANDHCAMVREWAQHVWLCWQEHHSTARSLAQLVNP